MALSGLDIYKLLPKTNCKACGLATCLAFAMQLAKKAVPLDKCPYISQEARSVLEASAQPPIKLITIGSGNDATEIGNESVLFRHEEKFHHATALGFIIEDSEGDSSIREKVERADKLRFERVGQTLSVNLIALRQNKDRERFLEAFDIVSANTGLGLVLMSDDPEALKAVLKKCAERRPLIFPGLTEKIHEIAKIALEAKCPLVATADGLEQLPQLTTELNKLGVNELVLDSGKKNIPAKLWELTQMRRLSLKKSNRGLGYPPVVVIENADPLDEAMEAATFIAKYAGVILVGTIESWQSLSLLTLRQNIYTDPQKPLQIEPKLYPIGTVSDKSPVLVTTNFSLSYYTVLGEVEASKVPSYIISVDTEGMSVLTAWAAEKFTPERIANTIDKCGVTDAVSHKNIIIPGYVAVMSGDLEEESGWKVVVGPKEAAGIPSFLKNL